MQNIIGKYDVVIGLEIHAELNTKSKCFCSCANEFGSAPNTNTCPVCLAMPGALPVLNREAVRKTILAGLAIDCKINDIAIFERKHYFYPDLSKAYQISQLVKPICLGGGIKLQSGKFIRLNRIHLEEDAGKLTHNAVRRISMVDYNRGGVPLIEIVTEPDISTAPEAVEFLESVRERLTFGGIANCRMEQGGMRCDVNLSLKPKGSKTLGNRCEIKNLNSFRSVARAIEYEAERQAEILDANGRIVTETRKWDEGKGKTLTMRTKEESQDYRYFPDPDIYTVKITEKDVADIKKTMPVLAHELRLKFTKEYGLSIYDANVLTRDKVIADFYLACIALYQNPKKIANWILTDVLARLKDTDADITAITTPKTLTEIVKMVEEGKVTKLVGLDMLDGKVKLTDTAGVTDAEIKKILIELKNTNPKVAADYAQNPQKVVTFIIGQVMKTTRGKAKSDKVEILIKEVF